jgi:hypothetical protein
MREKEERKGWQTVGRRGESKAKGYTHRLDQVATSFFFTNFPEDIKSVDLWPKFAHFGRVGEVYIPKKLDKQGRRFGFVKYRDVKDAKEQLRLISNIWVGSFKLRVNLPRFEKGSTRKVEQKQATVPVEDVPESSNRTGAAEIEGRSFKSALVVRPEAHNVVTEQVDRSKGEKIVDEVVWEVEVEAEALAKLNGAYVGFLSEHRDHCVIQQNFLMDGYSNIRITPLGYLQVLISSSEAGEVHDLVGTVGWWCTWFDRFENWSPELVSNQRVVWLSCFGVPLHA